MDVIFPLQMKKLRKDAILPEKAHKSDAGFDLFAVDSGIINPGERGIIDTGIALKIPSGHVGLIWPRSGLAVKSGIHVMAGVIDSGYRGEIKVCLFNSSKDSTFSYGPGAKVAQIIIQKLACVVDVEVDELEDSDRGECGFGSTG